MEKEQTTINDKNEIIKNITSKINTTKLLNFQGIKFIDFNNLLFYIQGLLFTLSTKNKNYTKEQKRLIETLKDIFECMGE